MGMINKNFSPCGKCGGEGKGKAGSEAYLTLTEKEEGYEKSVL
jgi:hypothetical protein